MNASPSFIERLNNLFTNFLVVADTELETFCKKNFRQIPEIAYRNKRKIESLSYSIVLNELIQPRAFEVRNLIGREAKISNDSVKAALSVGGAIAEAIRWDDDKNLDKSGDYYLTPSETIRRKRGDCEDIALTVSSAAPQHFGCAWGFWDKEGHCFNVFVYSDELYVLDCVSGAPRIYRYEGQTQYKIHYIVTERFTFQLDGSVRFGDIAGWN